MKKETALKILFDCAKDYKENLAEKNLLFICTNSAQKTFSLETVFSTGNYLHMTGVKFKTGLALNANDFFSLCVDKRLRLADFELSEDGTTELKLKVLPSLMKRNISASMAGDYSGVRPWLFTEKLAGGVCGGIGFVFDEKRNLYVPNTVLNEDIRKLTKEKVRIIATYRKEVKDKTYSECVYRAKKIAWDKITYPSPFEYIQRENVTSV